MKPSLFFFFAIFTTLSHANTSPAIVAKVTGTGTYGDGAVYVFFDRPIASCSNKGRLDFSATHPAKKNILSIAMTAFISGKPVKVRPESCDGSKAVFSESGNSYFYLTNEKLK